MHRYFVIVFLLFASNAFSSDVLQQIRGVWQISGAHFGSTAWFNNALLIKDNKLITISGMDVERILQFKVIEELDASVILETRTPESQKRLGVEKVYFRFNLNQCLTKGINTEGKKCYNFEEDVIFSFCMYKSLKGAQVRDKSECYAGAKYYPFIDRHLKELQEMNELL